MTPSLRLNLHLDSSEFQVAIKWWLGLPACQGQICPQCSSHSLDYFGHHALTGRKGPDVVTHHNRIRDTIFELCQLACLGAQLEARSSLGHEERQTRPADILVPNWKLGQHAAIDLSITSPLCHENIQVACVMTGSAALWAEKWKHNTNDEKCRELGWVSSPLVVESYGCWGTKAQHFFSRLSGRLASRLNQPKSITTNQMYGGKPSQSCLPGHTLQILHGRVIFSVRFLCLMYIFDNNNNYNNKTLLHPGPNLWYYLSCKAGSIFI